MPKPTSPPEGTTPPEETPDEKPDQPQNQPASGGKVHLRITTPFLDNFQVEVNGETHTVTAEGADFDSDVAEAIKEAAKGNKEVSLGATQAKES